jgi:hypothetical protein
VAQLEAALQVAFQAKQRTLRPEIQMLNRLLALGSKDAIRQVGQQGWAAATCMCSSHVQQPCAAAMCSSHVHRHVRGNMAASHCSAARCASMHEQRMLLAHWYCAAALLLLRATARA